MLADVWLLGVLSACAQWPEEGANILDEQVRLF
jgi:hypothetical protein